jgi:hypothetical protein
MTKEPTSALPEKFEDFEKQMEKEAQPAAQSPKPSKKLQRPKLEDVKGVGGMEKTKWSGKDMWRCPKCHATTFDETESVVHKCKKIKSAGEEGLSD